MKILAPAKVNLYLAVGNLRPDGYHDLETIFQTVGLYDELAFARSRDINLKASGSQMPSEFPQGPKNIVWRAADEFFRAFRVAPGVSIALKKNIPVQAGLGGGSSDAAAALKGCAKLFLKKMGTKEEKILHSIARGLGADVPFFLKGGCAAAGGVGEKLSPLPSADFCAVIVKPKIGFSTREVYGWFDQDSAQANPLTPAPQIRKILQPIRLRKPFGEWTGGLYNSFQDVVIRRAPEIESVRSALLRAGCFSALLSGSGSAVFGIVKDNVQGEKVRRAMGRAGHKSWVVRSVPG